MAATVAGCVAQLLQTGGITQQQANQVLQQQQSAVHAGVQNPGLAAIQAQRATLTRQKYLAALQAQVLADLLAKVQSHPKGIADGIQSLLAQDPTTAARYSNVDRRTHAIVRQYTAKIADALEAMRLTNAGFAQDRALIDDVVRELFGRSTGNADAARFGKMIGEAFEELRLRFNAAGGDIPKLKDWGMPQRHDARRVQEMGLPAWKQFILPKLDPQRMLGPNGLPMTPAELDQALNVAFETITTHGLNKLVPGAIAGKKLANQHQDHRFLIFKDADAWLAYDKELGGGNPFYTMIGHIDGMAQDIALLEILGPSPTHAMRVLKDTAKKAGVEGNPMQSIDALWETVSGAGNGVATLKLSTIDRLKGLRNLLTSAHLGSAILSSPSDLAFMRHTAAWNGLDQARTMRTFLSLLNPANTADRKTAVQLGLTAEAWTSLALSGNRFAEVSGEGLSARAADLTLRLSGMNHWTDAAQKAIGLEWLMKMADQRMTPWSDLPAANKILLEETGFTEADWDIIRHAPLESSNGVDKLDLPKLLQKRPTPEAQRAVNLAFEAIESLTHLAIPSPDARTRAIGARFGPRGTIGREFIGNSVLQFKSFPMAVILSHGYRGIYQGALGGKAAYLGSLVLAATVMGALSVQLKEVAKGRTPKPMDNPQFWAAAFSQGGGAGIFGDFVYSGLFGSNRFGQSFTSTLLGPTAGLLENTVKLTAGQLGDVIEGKKNNLGASAVNALGSYTPVIGSLWYTRLAYERAVLNQLQLQVDPDARRKFRQDAARRRKEDGNTYWWKRGELTP